MSKIPSKDEAIMLEPSMICEKHQKVIQDYSIPYINALHAAQGVIVDSDHFFEITYRIKNGYGVPDDVETGEVPDGEKPGIKHINDALEEIEHVCCFIVEHEEHPFPEMEEENEDSKKFLALIADYAQQEMEDDNEL